jgi:hypothetical protein
MKILTQTELERIVFRPRRTDNVERIVIAANTIQVGEAIEIELGEWDMKSSPSNLIAGAIKDKKFTQRKMGAKMYLIRTS